MWGNLDSFPREFDGGSLSGRESLLRQACKIHTRNWDLK